MNRINRLSVAPPGSAGFSLVEAIVSSALLGLAAVTVLTLLLRSGLNNLEARRADALTAAALSSLADLEPGVDLDQVWCASTSDWRDDCGTETPRFRRVVRSVPSPEASLPSATLPVQEVTIEVISPGAGRAAGERTLRLVTLRMP